MYRQEMVSTYSMCASTNSYVIFTMHKRRKPAGIMDTMKRRGSLVITME